MGETELETQVCLNDKCPDYKKKNTGKIIKKGFNEKGYQMYKCKICGVRYPESKGWQKRSQIISGHGTNY